MLREDALLETRGQSQRHWAKQQSLAPDQLQSVKSNFHHEVVRTSRPVGHQIDPLAPQYSRQKRPKDDDFLSISQT